MLKELSLKKLEYGSGAAACKYDGSTRYVRITDIDNEGNLGDDIVSPNSVEEKYVLHDGDILFARTGATVGKTYLYRINDGRCIYAGFLIRLVPNINIIRPEYLYYYTKSPTYKRVVQNSMKVVAQPNINAKQYGELELNVPTLKVQDEIILKLGLVNSIIILRKRELQKLDQLIKARFVEMFGDLEKNPYGWNKVGMSTVVDGKASNGYFAKREEYVKDGNVGILGVAYVVNRMYSQAIDLPRTNATAQDIKKYGVKYGDMLFCRSSLVAAGIGKASIVPQNIPDNTLFECHVIRIPLDLKKCVPEYMQVLSTTEFFRKQMIAQSKTATMTTIGQDGILRASIVLPPIEKQRDFYTFVKQIDKSKYMR